MKKELKIDKLNAKKDLIYGILVAVFSWFIFSEYDAFETMVEFAHAHEDYELDEILLLLILIGVISTWFAYRRIKEANKINKELENLTVTLKQKVDEEIQKQQDQEQLLIQQSRLASMGEMIGNIAHQWRQPLNSLGLVLQNINFTYQMDELDDVFVNKSITKANLLIQSMSKTIDDFRNFFQPNKEKITFSLLESINKALKLIDSTFENNNIKIIVDIKKTTQVYGYPNEFSQSLLNVLSNAKDALLDNKIKDACIVLEVGMQDNFGYVKVQDNAKGVPLEIIESIFDPYFTTKEQNQGTGIGLYMSKIIIEQNMGGHLDVKNINGGAEFMFKIPLDKDNND